MQSLRHCSRRGERLFQATAGTHRTCVGSLRAYSAETTSRAKPRKSKEERHELVMQFVAKFKASNNGQLPGISLLRKEVGGSYQILKDILQGIDKGQDGPGTSGQKVELEKVECRTKESVSVGKDGHRRPSNLNAIEEEVLKEGKKIVPQVMEMPKPMEITKAAGLRMTTLDLGQMIHSVTSVEGASQSVVDTSLATDATDEEDDDSKVAAPEYNHVYPRPHVESSSQQVSRPAEPSSSYCLAVNSVPASTTCADLRETFKDCGEILNAHVHAEKNYWVSGRKNYGACALVSFKTEEGLKAAKMKEKVLVKGQVVYLKSGLKRQNEYQATKSKNSEVKEVKAHVVQSKNNSATKHAPLDGKFEFGHKNDQLMGQTSPFTTVVRISNLPSRVTSSKLRSTCEIIASVYGLEMRRGGIADVHFNVKDNREMNAVVERLRKVTLEQSKLKVFLAPRFLCGKEVNKAFKPQDVNHLRQVRETVLNQFEQRIKQLRAQVQDYRELLAMKRET